MSVHTDTPSSPAFASVESTGRPPNSSSLDAIKGIEKPDVTVARDSIISFLRRCNIPYPKVVYDHEFDAQCQAEARLRCCPLDGAVSLSPFIPGGVVMATTAYAHLKSTSTQIYIALYTAFLIYIDDKFQRDVTGVREFNQRFVAVRSQADQVLDCFAALLRHAPGHFGHVQADIIIAATMNFVAAQLIEYETQGMQLSTSSQNYLPFVRFLSGASPAYSVMVFPPEIPCPAFIQALPDMIHYINYGNDILSFYKEELTGETENFISMLAAMKGISKAEAISELVNDTVDAHKRVLRILAPHADAYDTYHKFSQGYISFHAGLTRYRLNELDL